MCQRGRDARGVRADLALFRAEPADRRRREALRADLAAGARACGVRGRPRGRRLGRVRVRPHGAGRAGEGRGPHHRRRAADAPPPRPAARDDALADRRGARARRAGDGLLALAGHDLRAVRLRHGVDDGRDRPAARACGALRGKRYGGRCAPCSARRGRAVGRRDLRSRRAADAGHVRALLRLVAGPAAGRSGMEAPRRRRAAMRGARHRRRAVGLRALSRQRGVRAWQRDRPYPRRRGDGRFARGDARDLALPVRHRLDGAGEGASASRRSSAAALDRRAAAAEFSPARGHLGAADRCRRGAVGALLCVGRCGRRRGDGRILLLERRALARFARGCREDGRRRPISPARSPRSAASISAVSASRTLPARCACASLPMVLLRVPMRCSAPTASPGARRYSDAGYVARPPLHRPGQPVL